MFDTKFSSSGGQFDSSFTGIKFIKGEDGYTPVKGVDYWTESEIEEVKNSISNDIKQETVPIIHNTTKKYRVYVQTSTDKTETYGMEREAVVNTIPIRNAGGTIIVGTPTEDTHAATKKYVDDEIKEIETTVNGAITNESFMSYQQLTDKRLGSVEQTVGTLFKDVAFLMKTTNNAEWITVEGNNQTINVPSGVRQYAQILEIHGQWSVYPVYASYCNYVKNYPRRILTDTDKVLFEMPADVESRLTDFGINGNCLLFDYRKVFYRRGAKIVDYNYKLQDGEKFDGFCEDTYRTVLLAEKDVEIIDISDYISFDGIFDIRETKQIIVEMKYSEDDIKAMISNPDDVDMFAFNYQIAKTKFVFEA